MDKDIVISIKAVLFTLGLFLGIYVVYKLGPILILLVIALLLVLSLEPGVKYLMSSTFMNRPFPRSAAVLVTYIIFVMLFIIIFTIGIPPVLVQSQKLILGLTQFLRKIPFLEEYDISISTIVPQLSAISGGVFNITVSLLGNIFELFSIIVISIYMSLDWFNIKKRFLSLFPKNIKDEIEETIEEIELNIGHWVKGQLFLMLVVGTMSFVGLLLLGIDSALALGLVAGLLEIVPVLGPLIAAILASMVGFSSSPVQGFAVIGLFIIIQQLENNLLVPKVMQRVSGFSPLVILVALLVGSEFFGVVGAIVAVPVTMILVVIAKHVLRYSP